MIVTQKQLMTRYVCKHRLSANPEITSSSSDIKWHSSLICTSKKWALSKRRSLTIITVEPNTCSNTDVHGGEPWHSRSSFVSLPSSNAENYLPFRLKNKTCSRQHAEIKPETCPNTYGPSDSTFTLKWYGKLLYKETIIHVKLLTTQNWNRFKILGDKITALVTKLWSRSPFGWRSGNFVLRWMLGRMGVPVKHTMRQQLSNHSI